MKKLNIRPFSTPLIIGAGIFSATTGLLMFFVSEDPFKFAHEIVGIGFAVAIVLHISTNWRPFKRYFSQRGVIIIALALMMGVGMVISSAMLNRDEPEELIMETIEQTSLDRLAPMIGMEPHELVQQLATDGFTLENPQMTVEQISEELGVDTDDILQSIFR